MTGTVKWFNTSKGFGFVVPDGGGTDVFVHFTELRKCGISTLSAGQRIEFEAVPGRRNWEVRSPKLLETGAPEAPQASATRAPSVDPADASDSAAASNTTSHLTISRHNVVYAVLVSEDGDDVHDLSMAVSAAQREMGAWLAKRLADIPSLKTADVRDEFFRKALAFALPKSCKISATVSRPGRTGDEELGYLARSRFGYAYNIHRMTIGGPKVEQQLG